MVDGMRPMCNSIMTMNRNPQQSNNINCIMGWRGAGIRPIYNAPITIKTFYVILKGRVDGLF